MSSSSGTNSPATGDGNELYDGYDHGEEVGGDAFLAYASNHDGRSLNLPPKHYVRGSG